MTLLDIALTAGLTIAGLGPIVYFSIRQQSTRLINASNDIAKLFTGKTVKSAMSILGKHSGEVRGDAATENVVMSKLIETQFPEAALIAEQLGLTDFMDNPAKYAPVIQKYWPMIQGFMQKKGSGSAGSAGTGEFRPGI